MWSAIRNDLFEFVNVVSNDTKVTLTKVLGEDTIDNNKNDGKQQKENKILELQRSRKTYSLSIDETDREEYSEYFRSFSLSSHANDISQLIEREGSVSKYYSELVPTVLIPEEFWSRYFFRYKLLMKSNSINLNDIEELDEEDISWETSDIPILTSSVTSTSPPAATADTNISSQIISPEDSLTASQNFSYLKEENSKLSEENLALKLQIQILNNRIEELESELKQKEIQVAVVNKSKSISNKSNGTLTTATKGKKSVKGNSKIISVDTTIPTATTGHEKGIISTPLLSSSLSPTADITLEGEKLNEEKEVPKLQGGAGGVVSVSKPEPEVYGIINISQDNNNKNLSSTETLPLQLPTSSNTISTTNINIPTTTTTSSTTITTVNSIKKKEERCEKEGVTDITFDDIDESDENWSTSWS